MDRTIRQPAPRDPRWPRYSERPFPPYRYVPRLAPHPYRDPDGHSYGRGLPNAVAFAPKEWRSAPEYLAGIDFYNFGYWWEAHEILEEIWHKVGHQTEQGQFLQGLIQVSAGLLHRFGGRRKQARVQLERGLDRLRSVPEIYMGLDVAEFIEELHSSFEQQPPTYPLIRLRLADDD